MSNTLVMAQNEHAPREAQSSFGAGEFELMQKMFADAPVAMVLLEGPDHRIHYMNRYFHSLFGNRSFQKGTSFRTFGKELGGQYCDGENVFDILDRVYRDGEPRTVNEFRMRIRQNASGELEQCYFNFICQPLEDREGEICGTFISGYDVTDHVMAREEKVHSERRLSMALEGARIGFWEIDLKEKRLDYASDQCREHFGLSPEEPFTYKDILKAIHPGDLPMVLERLRRVRHYDSLYEAEYRVTRNGRPPRWILSRGKGLQNDEGEMYRLIGITLDISQHKEAEKKLKDAVKLRDNFLAIASHELQTPVTSIKASTELFERELQDDGKQQYAERAGEINSRVDQLSDLTGNLLDISRIQEGGLRLEKSSFSLKKLIRETVHTLRYLSDHRIEVVEEEDVTLHGDRYRIGQVLTNLIENAIKYSPGADRVVVRYRRENDRVRVSVEDFGIGISDSDKERIFERFFKGEEADKKTWPGFGVGLYICSRIVNRHNGTIRVEDNGSSGTVITFALPLNPQ